LGTSVEETIGVAKILVASANVIATVRVAKLAAWPASPNVTPVATVTVHSVPALSVALAVVNVSVEVAVPEFAAATVKVVEPQSLPGVASAPVVI
jgi:hypothetical protein